MATHNLFHGGQRTGNSLGPTNVFPSTEPDLTDRMAIDVQKGNIDFALTRILDFEGGSLVQNPAVPPSLSPEAWATSPALRNYMRNTAIANGDVIVTHILPKYTQLLAVHWAVYKVITPFTFTIRVRGQANSIGGVINLKTGVDGTAIGSGVIDCSRPSGLVTVDGNAQVGVPVTVTNAPIYFDENDALEVLITALPAAGSSPNGELTGGIIGSAFSITPVVRQFIRGT